MNKFYVYVYVDGNSMPLYVGKGYGGRDRLHLCPKRLNDGNYWHKKLRKIICEKQEFRIVRLFENLTEEQAFAWEIGLIADFGRKDLKTGILYNMTDGGEGAANGTAQRKNMQRLHTDPTFIEAQAESMRVLNSDSKFAAATAEHLRSFHKDPNFVAAASERLRLLHKNPIYAAAHAERNRERMKVLNSNPEFVSRRSERMHKRMRLQYIDRRVFAVGQFWYKVDLANKFKINRPALSARIKSGWAPTWACLWQSRKRIPDYCKPKHIPRIFGDRPSAEAFDYMYANWKENTDA